MTFPLSLIPVQLKEAVLDSPSFRCSVVYFNKKIDAIEQYLNDYIQDLNRVSVAVGSLEESLAVHFSRPLPSHLGEEVLGDYAHAALDQHQKTNQEFWSIAISQARRVHGLLVEPFTDLRSGALRDYRETFRALESAQYKYDLLLQRYSAQSRAKDAALLRDDAFSLHEARKAYTRAALDFCIKTFETQHAIDKFLIRATSDASGEQSRSRRAFASERSSSSVQEKIRNWSNSMAAEAGLVRHELGLAANDLELQARSLTKPSSSLGEYNSGTNLNPHMNLQGIDTVTGNGYRDDQVITEKQGWLFVRTSVGKQGARSVWLRRWYVLKGGLFCALIQNRGGVEEAERLSVLLCSVKPATTPDDRRFLLEVKTTDQSLLLQAETQMELNSWLNVFESAKRAALASSSPTLKAGIVGPPGHKFEVVQKTREEPDYPGSLGSGLNPHNSSEIKKSSVPEEDSIPPQHAKLNQRLEGSSRRNTTSTPIVVPAHAPVTWPLPMAPSGFHQQEDSVTSSLFANQTSITSLAPSTLINTPVGTSLSKQAVILYNPAEKAHMGSISIMANTWGTTNWGKLPDIGELEERISPSQTFKEVFLEVPSLSPQETGKPDSSTSQGQANLLTDGIHQTHHQSTVYSFYPPNYPQNLRQNDAQLHALFPDIEPEEVALLAFRANWQPNNAQTFPGRVWATGKSLYFYSNYGLVLLQRLSLRGILEVRRDTDTIYFGLREGEDLGLLSGEEIALTVYIENTSLLELRLRYLVSVATSTSLAPMTQTSDVIDILLSMYGDGEIGVTGEIWEDSADYRRGEYQSFSNEVKREQFPSRPLQLARPVDNRTALSSLMGQATKFYEKTFNVSAKALFTLIFGHKSRVFTEFYAQRRSAVLHIGPWILSNENSAAVGTRELRYMDSYRADEPIKDSQTVKVLDDNRCYVVLDVKFPWQLPNPKSIALETTIVISYVSKTSACLTICAALNHVNETRLWKDTITSKAETILRIDVKDLTLIVEDFVNSSGRDPRLSKIISESGVVRFEEAPEPGSVDITVPYSAPASKMQRVSYLRLTMEYCQSLLFKAMRHALDGAAAFFVAIFTILRTKWILFLALGISILFNLNLTYHVTRSIWHEKAAFDYVSKIGVAPSLTMGRYLTFREIDMLTTSTPWPSSCNPENVCLQRFVHSMGRRSQQSNLVRVRLGIYRNSVLATLKLINRIEKTLIQDEWENWLWIEKFRCSHVLGSRFNGTINPEGLSSRDSPGADSYCKSCDVAYTQNKLQLKR